MEKIGEDFTQMAPTPPTPLEPVSTSVDFEEPRTPTPCSFQECTRGHRWPITLTIAPCPGCSGAVLAIQKTQCPYCNDPVSRTVLRSDFIPRGAGLSKRCLGHPPTGESMDLEMTRVAWKEFEETPAPTFAAVPTK